MYRKLIHPAIIVGCILLITGRDLYVFRHTFAILSYMKPLQLSKPHIVVMVGIPGSGKSFFAEHFAITFNASLVSFDKIRTSLFQTPTRSNAEQAAISRVADYMTGELLKTGRTIVYDGATESRVDRMNIAKLAKSAGYETLVVWVQTESTAAKLRATKPTRDKTNLTADQFDARIKRFTAPSGSEKVVVISGKHTYASQLKIVLKTLTGAKVNDIDHQARTKLATEGRRIAIR